MIFLNLWHMNKEKSHENKITTMDCMGLLKDSNHLSDMIKWCFKWSNIQLSDFIKVLSDFIKLLSDYE